VPVLSAVGRRTAIIVEIGGLPIRIVAKDPSFTRLLEDRYAGFVNDSGEARFEFEVELALPGWNAADADADVRVSWDSGRWSLERGDFLAEWDPATRRGRIRQSANPYSIDSVLRIVHTLLLAQEGGFLVHAASAVRNGLAFLFAGVSGAGKTTISRLAPPDAKVLTDEISYVRRENSGYFAYGTPFAGELARVGENMRAPIETLYLLAKGPENKIESLEAAAAARALLENILFFAKDPALVNKVFQAACEFVGAVPVRRLTFAPDARVWELIR
jgi:hypothetical protein